MKHHAPLPAAISLGLMVSAPLVSQAQTKAPLPPTAPPVFVPVSYSASPQNTPSAPPATGEAERESIITALRLDAPTVAKLDHAYETYARTRLEQEAQIATWQEDLRTAQAATTFNEGKAKQLSGDISGAENRIAGAYLKARGEALGALTSLQRIRLEKLEVEAETRPFREDKYRFLLLSQVEDLWRTPIDPETGQALLSSSLSAASAARVAQQNYYAAPPFYYGYGGYGWNGYDSFAWNSYNYNNYGYRYPFYAHSGSRWNRDGSNFQNNPRDRNARPLWERDRTDRNSQPSVTFQTPRASENRRPLYVPQNPVSSGSTVIPVTPRPQPSSPSPTPSTPTWERQRETPRPEPSRPDPPRAEPKRPEPSSNNDSGSRWNRGGGDRGGSDGGSRPSRGR